MDGLVHATVSKDRRIPMWPEPQGSKGVSVKSWWKGYRENVSASSLQA